MAPVVEPTRPRLLAAEEPGASDIDSVLLEFCGVELSVTTSPFPPAAIETWSIWLLWVLISCMICPSVVSEPVKSIVPLVPLRSV